MKPRKLFTSMAPKRRRSRTILPWILATEALASHQTDTSILTELVKKIPGELRENEWKNARELVSLRILESLSVLEKGKSSDGLSDRSARISPLDSCEDVLRRVQRKSSGANRGSEVSEVSGREVEAFVRDKRSCLPKCGLEKVKDLIMKKSDLIPLSVKEMSGLLNKKYSGGNGTRPERCDSDANENPSVGDFLSGKVVMGESATADHEGPSACNQLTGDKECPRDNASLKRKSVVFCTQKVVEGTDLASSNTRRHVGEVLGGTVQQSGREESVLPREPRVGNLCETVSTENVHPNGLASKKLKMSSTVGDAEFLHNQLQGNCNVEKVTQGTSGKEHGLNIRADEAKKDCAGNVELENTGYVEMETRGSTARFANQGKQHVGRGKENSEHSFSLTRNSVRCGEDTTTMEHHRQPETFSDDENDEILIRNNPFSNSQYSHSQDSLVTLNGTEKLCMVCKKGGQLLVCHSESCQRVIHEKCMRVAPTFNATRSFYCPFCAYSQTILEYSKSKKKYSLARKALLSFVNRDEYRARNSYNIFCRADQNLTKESEICNKCVELRLKNVVSREIENSSRKNMRDKPSLSSDLSSRERARDVTCGANEVALEDKRNAERGSSVCYKSPSELEQQIPVLVAQIAEAESSLHVGGEQFAAVEKLQQVPHQPKSVALGGNLEEQYVTSQDKRNAERGSSVCYKSPSELEQQIPVLVAQSPEAESSLHVGGEQLASVEKLQQVSHQPKSVALGENLGEQDVPSQAVHDSIVQNSKSKEMKIAHGSKLHAGTEKEQDVPNQPPVLPCKPANPKHSDVAKGSGEKEKSSTHPSLRVRKREPQYTYPSLPQMRRKIIPWSNAEEEALKDGIRRFAVKNDKPMPWKKILESGADLFVNRTTIDLKDKWRNICKGSSKI